MKRISAPGTPVRHIRIWTAVLLLVAILPTAACVTPAPTPSAVQPVMGVATPVGLFLKQADRQRLQEPSDPGPLDVAIVNEVVEALRVRGFVARTETPDVAAGYTQLSDQQLSIADFTPGFLESLNEAFPTTTRRDLLLVSVEESGGVVYVVGYVLERTPSGSGALKSVYRGQMPLAGVTRAWLDGEFAALAESLGSGRPPVGQIGQPVPAKGPGLLDDVPEDGKIRRINRLAPLDGNGGVPREPIGAAAERMATEA